MNSGYFALLSASAGVLSTALATVIRIRCHAKDSCLSYPGYTTHAFDIVPQCIAGARRSMEANGFQCRIKLHYAGVTSKQTAMEVVGDFCDGFSRLEPLAEGADRRKGAHKVELVELAKVFRCPFNRCMLASYLTLG